MNINSMLNRALIILANKGQLYKYNTFKFYSEDTGRYSTKHQLLKQDKITERYIEVKSSYSNREILKYLMEEIRRMD